MLLNAAQIQMKAVKSIHGESVTYAREGSFSITLDAVRGQTDPMRMSVQPGLNAEDLVADWLLDYDDMLNGSTVITPERGDTITDSNGTTYRLMPPGQDEPVWRWHGNVPRVAYRVHTKER